MTNAASQLDIIDSSQDKTPLNIEYDTEDISPSDVAIVPILRSGLGMIDGLA